MNLQTTFMGIELRNPIIVGSSSLTDSAENVRKIARAGAGAVVLKSLYEEQILADTHQSLNEDEKYTWYPQAMEYVQKKSDEEGIDNYLNLIKESKKQAEMPIIASINCFSLNNWVNFSKEIENAGADGIELNISIFPENENIKSETIENEYFKIVKTIKEMVKIPVAVKMSTYFTNIKRAAKNFELSGASGLVLFNRYYRPDIDIDYLQMITYDTLSGPEEITQSLRWIGLLSKKLSCDLVASTGIHNSTGIIKQILAGAKAAQICSVLYENGVDYVRELISDIQAWMNRKGFNSIDDFRGLINKDPHNTLSWERIHFMKKSSGDIIKPLMSQ